jgi:hypothetical protein
VFQDYLTFNALQRKLQLMRLHSWGKRNGRWRGKADIVHGPHEASFLIASAPATFIMSRARHAHAHRQDEYAVAADVRFVFKAFESSALARGVHT